MVVTIPLQEFQFEAIFNTLSVEWEVEDKASEK